MLLSRARGSVCPSVHSLGEEAAVSKVYKLGWCGTCGGPRLNTYATALTPYSVHSTEVYLRAKFKSFACAP